jgi:hypothetical protein
VSTPAKPRQRESTLPQRDTPMARTPLTVVRDIGSGTARTRPRQKPARDTGPDAKTRKLVLERDGYACVCCGWSILGQPYSLQHRKRRSQGGGNSPPNLITVLGTGTTGCHLRIDSRIDPEDEEKGYTVRSWQDPADVPVMVFSEHGSGATVWLTADGRYSDEPPLGGAA